MKCNICGGNVIYKRSKKYQSGYCYQCVDCKAEVGTFKKDKDIPMGQLADFETRVKRIQVHRLFDRFWRSQRTRTIKYRQLAQEMGIEETKCHFAKMSKEELEKAEQILLKWWREKYDK